MGTVKELFDAFSKKELPTNGGYIVSAFFDDTSTYTKYEIISFSNVKDIYANEEGLVFQADGQKVFVLIEPANYPNKHIEPAYRNNLQSIPYRMKELLVHTSSRQDRIMIGKEPVITYTAFTVLKSFGQNYSYIFYMSDDILDAMRDYFMKSIWKEARVPRVDAQKVTELILEVFKKIIVH
ncbi:MAG TPA: transposase [Spirochaetales bacterium]|nr:transposase [Spirochaetales bacterium]HOV38434.1 transposase [Spirochaetales bacterium]